VDLALAVTPTGALARDGGWREYLLASDPIAEADGRNQEKLRLPVPIENVFG